MTSVFAKGLMQLLAAMRSAWQLGALRCSSELPPVAPRLRSLLNVLQTFPLPDCRAHGLRSSVFLSSARILVIPFWPLFAACSTAAALRLERVAGCASSTKRLVRGSSE